MSPGTVPACSICQNAYGRHVCQRCEQDPANRDWVEGQEVLLEPGKLARAMDRYVAVGRPSRLPKKYIAAARHFVEHPSAGLDEIARAVRCSRRYVIKVFNDVFSLPEDRRRDFVARISGPLHLDSKDVQRAAWLEWKVTRQCGNAWPTSRKLVTEVAE